MGNKCCKNDSNLEGYPKTDEEKRTMKRPFVAATAPKSVELQPGKEYHWCSCGLSKNQPFCDGSHKGTPYQPVAFVATKKDNHLCMCKQTHNKPYCDGTHNKLDF